MSSMQTYHITCKCGHDFPIPAQFLSTDEDERAALIKALEGLMCPDCIQDAIDRVHALREHLLKITAIPPDLPETLPKDLHQPLECPDESPYTRDYERPFDIMDVGWRTLARSHMAFPGEPNPPITQREHTILAWIDRWNRHHPVGTEVLVIPPGQEYPPGLLGARTTSPARMHHGWAVVDVAGHGPIELDRLIDMTPTNKCMHYPEYSDASPWNAKVEYPIPKEAYAILHGIDSWNRDYPVGTEVYVNPTDVDQPYDPCTHRTTSPAKLLAGKPVVEVSGLGPIDLARLVPFG